MKPKTAPLASLGRLLVLGLLLASPAAAQQAGTLAGTVRSQAGLALPDVRVTLEPGGASAQTDSLGRFSLSAPPGAAGTLAFRKPGYLEESLRVEGLAPGGRRELAVTLVPLYTLDALTVTTERERPLLNTEDASTGGTIERLEAQVLPTDARDPLSLAFSVPGVAPGSGFFGDAPPLTIAGGNSLYTQYTLDGLDNNEGFLGGPRVEIPLAAISRLSVLANAYSAARGRSSNGVVDVESRAGGTAWAGEAFAFHRPGTPLDASPKHAPAGVDPDGFERVQVGGAAGGPLPGGAPSASGRWSTRTRRRTGSAPPPAPPSSAPRCGRRGGPSPAWTTAGPIGRRPPRASRSATSAAPGRAGE